MAEERSFAKGLLVGTSLVLGSGVIVLAVIYTLLGCFSVRSELSHASEKLMKLEKESEGNRRALAKMVLFATGASIKNIDTTLQVVIDTQVKGGGVFKDMRARSEGVEELRSLEEVLKGDLESILKMHGEVSEILKKDFSERLAEIKTKLSEVNGSLNRLLDVFDGVYVLQKELEATLSGLTTIPG